MPDGLSRKEVLERVHRGEDNKIRSKTSRSLWEIFRSNIFTLFNGVLGSLVVLVLVFGSPKDALFGLVLVFNSLIGIIQELRAKRTLDRLSLIGEPKARVWREGILVEASFAEVVLDDLVELRPGDAVVADGRLLESKGLELDESVLTGESVSVLRGAGEELHSGSICVAGSGLFVVEKVGRDTYAQHLAHEARKFSPVSSELHRSINRILALVSWSLLPVAAFLYYGQIRTGMDFPDAVMGTVAGLVGIIPQGLVLLTSLAFALSVIVLGRRNVLIEELPAVEVLARVDVLCLDKTGTLTDGSLEVAGLIPLGDFGADVMNDALASLCASSKAPNETLKAIGRAWPDDPGWMEEASAPFSSERKWSGSCYSGQGSWFLGAPEILLEASSGDAEVIHGRKEEISAKAGEGFRVLLLARSDSWVDERTLPVGLRPAGMLLLSERIREDARETLAYFREQQVAVKVISGDNPLTALAAAQASGLGEAAEAFDARFLPEDDGELEELMENRQVFGRVTPHQKRRMIRALQARGHVAAMTGDGVNDVLALKAADLGIAMGSGVAAAKGVARIVLLDGRFASLPGVVAEGRRIMGNIERVSNLFLTKSVYIFLLILAITLVGLPFPFLPRHLTLVSDFTIGIPAFFLALAPNLQRYRRGFLVRVLRFALPAGLAAALSVLGSFLIAASSEGVSLVQARTVATLVLLVLAFWFLSILARPLTRLRVLLLGVLGFSLAGVLLVPILREFFALSLPSPGLLAWGALMAFLGGLLIEWAGRRLPKEATRCDVM